MTNHVPIGFLGLSGRAIGVYRALLLNGHAKVRDIARACGCVRQLVYEALGELEGKGLVVRSPIGKNRYEYRPASPSILVDIAKQQTSAVESMMPKLMELYQSQVDVPTFRFYSGWNAIRSYWREFGEAKMTAEIVDETISATEDWYAADHTFMENFWEPNKLKKGVKTKLLASHGWVAEKQRERKHYEVRMLPKNKPFHGDITIYGDTVHYLALEKENQHMAVVVSAQIARSMHELFDIVWEAARMS
ncbi:helix-turn-helix domain-containing protein [Candidatus Uhrbacteria bacterium]|nr:helix-turn-helix domain-containing protein [Candidatus Uhrbacteria bacterium]